MTKTSPLGAPRTRSRRVLSLFALVALGLGALGTVGCSGKKKPAGGGVSAKPAEAAGEGAADSLRAAFDAYEAERFEQARELLLRAGEAGEGRPEFYSLLGLTLIKLDDLPAAKEALETGAQAHPGDPQIGSTFGELYLQRGGASLETGAFDAARRDFEAAVAAAPAGDSVGEEIERRYRAAASARLRAGDGAAADRLLTDYRDLGYSDPEAEMLRASADRLLGRDPATPAAPAPVEAAAPAAPEIHYGGFVPGAREPAPAGAGGPVQRARALSAGGKYREVLELALRDGGFGGDPEVLDLGFRAAIQLKSYPQAEELLARRESLGMDPVQAGVDRAELYAATGRALEAKDLLESALAMNPNDPRPRLELARYEAKHGDSGTAESHLMSLLNQYSLATEQQASVYQMLGIVCAKRKDLECAESWWTRQVAIDPENCKVRYNLGTLYGQKGRYRESVDTLEKAIECADSGDADYPKYLYWLALGYRQNGQNGEMCRALEKITALTAYKDPYHKRALEMRQKSGFCKVRGAIQGLPTSPNHALRGGFERLDQGDMAGAEGQFKRHLQAGASGQEAALAHLGLGRVARRRERFGVATAAFEAALAQAPLAAAQVGLAESLFDLGLYERSLAAWRKVSRDGEVPSARRAYEIARNLDRLGRAEEAMAAYEQSVSKDPDSLYADPARRRIDELVPSILEPSSGPSLAVLEARVRGLRTLQRAFESGADPVRAAGLEADIGAAQAALDAAQAARVRADVLPMGAGFGTGGPPAMARAGRQLAGLEPGVAAFGAPRPNPPAPAPPAPPPRMGGVAGGVVPAGPVAGPAAGDPEGEAALRGRVEADPSDGDAAMRLAEVVLGRPAGLSEGFQLLMQARQAGGRVSFRATRRMVELYRQVGQQEDARFLLDELANRSPEAPADLRRWAAGELAELPGQLAASPGGGGR